MRGIITFCVCFMLTGIVFAGDMENNQQRKELEINGSESIEHYLREGQAVVVQVTKDPLGTKGARLTTEISIPSRFQVYMPYTNNSGVSQRIESVTERKRLRACIEQFQEKNNSGGFIARTAAECIEEPVLFSDMIFLTKLWDAISEKINNVEARTLIHEDLPLSIRTGQRRRPSAFPVRFLKRKRKCG